MRQRFRDLGFNVGHYAPGEHNAITDVKGVRVGVSTVTKGEFNTGVTAILPNENVFEHRVPAGSFVLNGAGELMGLTQMNEWGLLETPILLTNTPSVGRVADACVQWMGKTHAAFGDVAHVVIPAVGECDDSFLNHVAKNPLSFEHVEKALTSASTGTVAEGNVGGGTGMICCDFKAGNGTSSRKVKTGAGEYTVGVLVQTNFGVMRDLRMNGVPVGSLFEKDFPNFKMDRRVNNYGSIIVVVATDAPLWTNQISRLCQRAALAIGRTGSHAAHGSGEIVVGFSTANRLPRADAQASAKVEVLLDAAINPLFEAVIETTEEAIYNSICMATDTTGFKDRFVPALPTDWLLSTVKKYSPAC